MENPKTTIPRITRMIPVALFNVSGVALLANLAAILAQIRVNTTHKINTIQSGAPPIIKWDAAPVNAVNAMINTLVPTAVFSSYPNTLVRISNIIIPPPAPTNPQISPITIPQITD